MANICATLPNVNTYVADGVGHVQLPMSGNVIKAVLDIIDGRVPNSVQKYEVGQ